MRDFPVSAAGGSPDGVVCDAVDQLRHDLKTPLTTISAHAQLLARSIRRAQAVSDEERARMLEGVAAIEGAVREMVTVVDGIPPLSSDGRTAVIGTGR